MISGTVVRDDSVWQGHPDVALFRDRIFVAYRQSNSHLASDETKVFVTSIPQDKLIQGGAWSEPVVVAEGNRFNCPRLSVYQNTLYLICDVIPIGEDFVFAENGNKTRVWIWSSLDGEKWSAPIKTNIAGIVPDRLFVAKDGSLLIAAHTMRKTHRKIVVKDQKQSKDFNDRYAEQEKNGRLIQNVYRAYDIGEKWEGPYKVADYVGYNFCEASLFEAEKGLIGCMMRENSRRGEPAYFTISGDSGVSWSGPYKTRMFGCHRPVTGRLRSRKILTTYREQSHSIQKAYWARNAFACLSDADDWKPSSLFVHSVILPLDHDRSQKPDGGYTGWVQLADDTIFVVNYITDRAPLPYIKWYLIHETDF